MAKRGRPKGSKNKATLKAEFDKEALRAVVHARVQAAIGPLLDAQIANATGIKYLVAREKKTGKFLRVVDIKAKLADNEEVIEVWEKDPSVQAFTDLLNRTIDKPAETLQADVKGDVLYRLTWKNSE